MLVLVGKKKTKIMRRRMFRRKRRSGFRGKRRGRTLKIKFSRGGIRM